MSKCTLRREEPPTLSQPYEMDHNVSLAIRTYQTAVKLDPTLIHAKDRLQQLKR